MLLTWFFCGLKYLESFRISSLYWKKWLVYWSENICQLWVRGRLEFSTCNTRDQNFYVFSHSIMPGLESVSSRTQNNHKRIKINKIGCFDAAEPSEQVSFILRFLGESKVVRGKHEESARRTREKHEAHVTGARRRIPRLFSQVIHVPRLPRT